MASVLGWHGNTTTTCEEIGIAELSSIKYYYEISQSGGGVKVGNPSLAALGIGDIQNIKCGSSSLLQYESESVVLAGYTKTSLSSNEGRIQLNFPEFFDVDNLIGEYTDANGTYKLTTYFSENKPTYKNENGWWIVWDEQGWKLIDSITNPTKTILKNKDEKPHGGIWDCEPSCQQEGLGPESPELTCIPTNYTTITYQSGTGIPIGDIGSGSFNSVGNLGFNSSEFPNKDGLPLLYFINVPSSYGNELALAIVASRFPVPQTQPTIYFESEGGTCYSGKLVKNTGDDNWTANLLDD